MIRRAGCLSTARTAAEERASNGDMQSAFKSGQAAITFLCSEITVFCLPNRYCLVMPANSQAVEKAQALLNVKSEMALRR